VSKTARDDKEISLVRIISVGENYYYFNIRRDYPSVKGEKYPDDTYMNGWIVKNMNGNYSLFQNHMCVSDFDDKDSEDNEITGIIEIDGKRFLISQNFYYESESYSIMEITNKGPKTLLDVFGGGC
jgi:hypothetical protein